MKNFLYILFLIFISCESDELGLNEHVGAFTYYDNVAFGWQSFFDKSYDLAIDFFNTAYESDDELYHNSAHVGLGWTYLFKSNLAIGNQYTVDSYRDISLDEFNFIDDESKAIISYSNNCPHVFCCDFCFSQDRQLGLLIFNIQSTDFITADPSDINALINELQLFVNNNANYDFMNGKPIGLSGSTVDIDIDNVILYLAQVYLRNNQVQDACELLVGTDLECESNCDNFENDDEIKEEFFDCVTQYSPLE